MFTGLVQQAGVFRGLTRKDGGWGIQIAYSPWPDALALGDAAAESIARQAAEDLAELAETGWKKSGSGKCSLVLTGSILLKFPLIREMLGQHLSRTCPLLQITEPSGSPAEGAAKMARIRFHCM